MPESNIYPFYVASNKQSDAENTHLNLRTMIESLAFGAACVVTGLIATPILVFFVRVFIRWDARDAD